MDIQNSQHSQSADVIQESGTQPDSAKPTPSRQQRNREFPLYFVETPDGMKMMGPTKLAAYEASLAAQANVRKEAREAARAARKTELAEGRPTSTASSSASHEPPADAVRSTLAPYRSSLARSSRKPSASEVPPPDLLRHSRCCSICSHPDRDAIEGDFIRWRSPMKIAEDYEIADRRNIYRHAHATGLFSLRSRQVARVMEQFLELVDHLSDDPATLLDFDTVTRAIRVYSHLDDDGRWFEPPRTHRIITGPPCSEGQSLSSSGVEPPVTRKTRPKRTLSARRIRPRKLQASARRESR
jgi:hypothetical protein